MAKNQISTVPLSLVEIVMRADAEMIRSALDARVKIDGLLAEREEAYRRIAELESQVDELIGEPGVFVFPEPPLPVSGFSVKAKSVPVKKPAAPKAAKETSEEPKEDA